jgi:Fungal specific transcription factor domain
VNMTDPQQSKSRESRKFVRRQVMVNFAREKRRQPKPSSPGGAQAGTSSSNTISGVQELLNAAMPTSEAATGWSPERGASGADAPSYHDMPGPLVPGPGPTTIRAGHGLQRRKSSRQPPPARLMPSTVSGASNLPGVEALPWPVEPGAHVQGLINHCEASLVRYSSPIVRHSNMVLPLGHSPLFRACHPQYMISLLANRPSAEIYPFFIDIDCVEDRVPEYGVQSAEQSEFYRLAEASPMLAHALLMASASHLALIEPEDASLRTRQAIDHKSKALQLLNEAIKGLPADKYVQILATIAVLASHEVGPPICVNCCED